MHKIIVNNAAMNFSAAHFISFGGKCERLHGHNYAVSAEFEGRLSKDKYVFDFVEVKAIMKELCNELDHRFLLPEKSDLITSSLLENNEWEIRYQNRRYIFPAEDVLVLPVDNITAERIAEHMCGRLEQELLKHTPDNIKSICVGVEEAPGQTAYFTQKMPGYREN